MELKHYKFPSGMKEYLLLIVPYGIETVTFVIHYQPNLSFNRTLWN